ncbi:MAG: diphosphomevalonate decarboxylase [Anaerolineae bacterium]|nr:diphosphomevalonate decarboxylase [Anaerolineae bacterium]MDW8067764.1 diphosphomevalonate decarboxylase [Anaerolineae bacterium]
MEAIRVYPDSSMSELRATAEAGANIALTKYWGNADPDLRIPANDSVSITLDCTRTVTTVAFQPDRPEDEITVDGRLLTGPARERVSHHLDLLRERAGVPWRARVVSRNNFPAGAGIAASASGFAALTLAGAAALGLDLSPRDLSVLARRGSGSAARSIFGGFVLLHTGARDEDAFAEPLYGPDWWDVRDLIVVVSRAEKAVPSSEGHLLAPTSALHRARVARVAELNRQLLDALARRDFAALGHAAEEDALLMHAVMMTSRPSLIYWLPETVALIRRVQALRAEGIPAYFTIDAGPNVHVLTLPAYADHLQADLRALPGVQAVISCRPGPGASVIPHPGE